MSYQIPFGPTGDLLAHDGYIRRRQAFWRDNTSFQATLRIDRVSAKGASVKDPSTGQSYWMMPTELDEVIQKRGIDKGGYVTAWWTFCKRTSTYGLRLA